MQTRAFAYLLAASGTAFGASAADDEGVARKSIAVVRADRPPVLDGRLDDAVWEHAAVVEDLHVVVSEAHAQPSERSRIYVMYDDDALYLAARFWDSEPGKVTARVLRRGDVSFGDDGFTITLDPYDLGRSGYAFDINPNGMRSEALYVDASRQNWEWEGIWNGAARRDEFGWTAEVAIPMKSLSFDPANDRWGINFTRWLGRRNEQFGWVSHNREQNLAHSGELSGMTGLRQRAGVDVIPGMRVGTARDFTTGENDSVLEPSLDAFVKITPSMTAALTINPDFAGTTADARQINLTRFDLFFPEQRAFFLQESDIFEFGRIDDDDEYVLPFFSRRIGLDARGNPLRLDGGVKMTGRMGPLSMGVLGIRQDAAARPGSTDLFVGRLAASVLAESSIGVIATSGNPDGDRNNSLAGLDFRYLNTRLGEDRSLAATAWFQKTSTEGLHGHDAAYGLRFMMPNSQGWSGGAGFKTLQENYFPALGFASRTDVVDYAAEIGHTWRPADSWIRAIKSGLEARRIDAIHSDEQSQEIKLELLEVEDQTADEVEFALLRTRERLVEPFEIADGIVIQPGDYSFGSYCIEARTGEHRDLASESSICNGDFYGGNISSVLVNTTWRPSAHLKVVAAVELNNVNLPEGDFVTRLLSLQADVAFNTRWSWENFVQYDNVSDTVGVNSILRWIPQAGRETVLAFNSQLEDFRERGRFHSLSSDLTLKLSHTFRF